MKIAIVTQDELNEIWDALQPQCRFMCEGVNGASLRMTNTLVVVDAEIVSFEQAFEEVKAANREVMRRREERRNANSNF